MKLKKWRLLKNWSRKKLQSKSNLKSKNASVLNKSKKKTSVSAWKWRKKPMRSDKGYKRKKNSD